MAVNAYWQGDDGYFAVARAACAQVFTSVFIAWSLWPKIVTLHCKTEVERLTGSDLPVVVKATV